MEIWVFRNPIFVFNSFVLHFFIIFLSNIICIRVFNCKKMSHLILCFIYNFKNKYLKGGLTNKNNQCNWSIKPCKEIKFFIIVYIVMKWHLIKTCDNHITYIIIYWKRHFTKPNIIIHRKNIFLANLILLCIENYIVANLICLTTFQADRDGLPVLMETRYFIV